MLLADIIGKESWRKERVLKNDKELDSVIVDKLAVDPAKGVRTLAVHHPKITQEGLWKVVTQKKNFTEEYILRSAFQRLTPELKVRWLKERKFVDIKSVQMLDELGKYAITNGMTTSTVKDDFSNILVELLLSKEFDVPFARYWILKHYDVKKNVQLFKLFETKYPDELVLYAEELGLSDVEVDDYFNKSLEGDTYFVHPNKFGGDFLEKMNSNQLIKMLKELRSFRKDTWYPLQDNPNFNSEHTQIVFKMNHNYNSDLPYIVENLPLDEKCEKQILVWFNNAGDQHNRKNWQVMEAWAKNKTHTRFLFKTVSGFGKDDGWSTAVIDNMLKTGKYNEDDFNALFANRSDYDKQTSHAELVSNPHYPPAKLRELWKHYWYNVFKNGEINEPDRYGSSWGRAYEESKINEILYKLVSKSALAGEFGMDYYEKTAKEDYLPAVAKEIFLF